MCHSKDLEPDDRGIRCRNCGTTYNLVTKPSWGILDLQPDLATGDKTPSPSAALARESAKARDQAKEVALD